MGPARRHDHAEIITRLRLIRSENVGPVTFGHLLRRYGDASRALAALPELAAQGGLGSGSHLRTGRGRGGTRSKPRHRRACIVRGMANTQRCWACEDAPAVFSLRGHGHLLARPAVAMVGTRNASASARRLTHAWPKPSRRRITRWFPSWPAAVTPPPIRGAFWRHGGGVGRRH